MRTWAWAGLLIVILVVGCNAAADNTASTPKPSPIPPSITVPIQLSPSVVLTASPPATTTTIPLRVATPTANPTTTPIPINFAHMCEQTELESVETVPGLRGILAYVVLTNANWQGENGQTGLVGGTPLQSRLFPPVSDIEVIGFSPNDNWFAYSKQLDQPGRLEPFVYLLSAQGETIKTSMPVKATDETLFWFATWISNELILVQFNSIPTAGGSGTVVIDSYAIINAFTGEERGDLLANLPHWDRWTTPYFSPDMTRVVYFSNPSGLSGHSIILWDIERQTVLWSKPFHSIFGLEENYIGNDGISQTAFWAPDSSAFIFTTGEIASDNERIYSSYLVERNGITEQLLVSSPDFSDVMVLGGLWSPDGRFIYYFYGNSFIYDLASNQMIKLCENFSTHVAWSPGSNYFAYHGRVDQESYLFLLNIYTGEVANIGRIKDIAGLKWLTNEAWLTIP